ncbi:hypothetical protein [Prauserella cavernicola]|uniref:Uncharacterized protein n=1 Tax=Prauserella cavernicola TaxID=2800127 RepID=A0A934QP55_9PSEU|nr:hypothetical protein [Prauserella cavernicola]MBK1783511.1 hypothetical protein [Prauserella cavernicola]
MSGPPTISFEWVQFLDEQLTDAEEVNEVPVIESASGCELFDPPEVGTTTPKPRGSGVSTFGEDGERYICQFGEPSITFVLGRTESEQGFEDTTLSADTPGMSEHEIEGVPVVVQDYTYPNGRAVQTAQILDAERRVFASAELETKPGKTLPDDWDTEDTARMLADFVRS